MGNHNIFSLELISKQSSVIGIAALVELLLQVVLNGVVQDSDCILGVSSTVLVELVLSDLVHKLGALS